MSPTLPHCSRIASLLALGHKRAMSNIEGPRGNIAFKRDRFGYPTIHARDLKEGTYALGYLHACDRLVQVTLASYAAQGRLMSLLGDRPIARLLDRGVRTVGLGLGLSEQIKHCDAESLSLMQAYSAGFNAGARTRGTPLVLRLLGAKVPECSPELIASVFRFISYFGLTSMQLSSELVVADLAARGAPAHVLDELLGPYARGIDLEALRGTQVPDEYSFFASVLGGSPLAGSNAFAVSKSKSATGGALLMGEFHMEVGKFPPLLYAAHVEMPDNYLCGITVPGMAWFAAGRTRDVGWSYTFAHADNVDFIVEKVSDGSFECNGRREPLRKREELVTIKNEPSETWVFYENDYGVILGDVAGEQRRLCLRLTGLSETHRTLSSGARLTACRNVEELLALQREIRSVSLEGVLADVYGDVAAIVTGQIDERPLDWTGAYPYPGWKLSTRTPGVSGEDERPVALRPLSGFVVSANQGGQGQNVSRWCSFPEPHYRFQRIGALLAARETHTLESLRDASYDVFDGCAARLCAIWAPLLPEHALSSKLVELSRVSANPSEGAQDRECIGLFHTLHEELCFTLLERDLGHALAMRFKEWNALLFYQHQLDRLFALERRELLDEAELKRLLAIALPKAAARYKGYPVPVRLRFKHLITQGKSPSFLGFDSRWIELPGSPTTPFQCRVTEIAGEKLVYGPAFHLAFDMSQKGARYNLPGGASECRFGPGYGAGIEEWLAGEMLELGV